MVHRLMEYWLITKATTNKCRRGLSNIQTQQQTTSATEHSSNSMIARTRNIEVIQGRLKCNANASFSIQQNITCIVMSLWDEEGAFVLANTIWLYSVYPIEVGETPDLYHAIKWANDMHFDNIDFVLDSKTIMDAFYNN
ncbi:hypothetical protein MTR_6g033225 [Medicago truncatula]|uniref:RNase H type-1 domain-containing protein n=1 Tax=Medicago truncatula TaxID=3880 RepID=A0A072U793_MEDTR|nr:hypothetical protein MTR_6g033225 [Medicago truncatula]